MPPSRNRAPNGHAAAEDALLPLAPPHPSTSTSMARLPSTTGGPSKPRRGGGGGPTSTPASLPPSSTLPAANGVLMAKSGSLNGTSSTPSTDLAGGGINWPLASPALLSTYRYAHRLPTPSAFHSPLAALVLTDAALANIGRLSPSVLGARARSRAQEKQQQSPSGAEGGAAGVSRRRFKHRIERGQLAREVRRSFNAHAVSEADCVVEFIYKVREQHRGFRLRFPPGGSGMAGKGRKGAGGGGGGGNGNGNGADGGGGG